MTMTDGPERDGRMPDEVRAKVERRVAAGELVTAPKKLLPETKHTRQCSPLRPYQATD